MTNRITTITSVVVFLLLWEILCRVFNVPITVLPTPVNILEVFFTDKLSLLLSNTLPTAIQVVAGFLVSIVIALLVAVVLSYFEWVREAVGPYIIVFQVIPKIALAPVFILWLGIGFVSRFAFVVFMCFFPIVISVLAGIQRTNPSVLRMCKSMGGSKAQILFMIKLKYAVPDFFSSLKICTTMALIGVIVSEFITANKGLGFLILWASSRLDTPLLLAAVLICCALGGVVYYIVSTIEKLVLTRMSFL